MERASFSTAETSFLLTGCQWFHTISSFSFMNNSKFSNVHGWSLLNNGIRAATETQLRKNTDKKFLAFYTAEALKTEPLLLT
ncbi:MAG: hypothetical protein ACTTI6_02910 [Treponema sp.]|uniref:hypothetical protein n=1 Tax=Treponema sp. TaxID=166 RepID=UPI003FA1B32C